MDPIYQYCQIMVVNLRGETRNKSISKFREGSWNADRRWWCVAGGNEEKRRVEMNRIRNVRRVGPGQVFYNKFVPQVLKDIKNAFE